MLVLPEGRACHNRIVSMFLFHDVPRSFPYNRPNVAQTIRFATTLGARARNAFDVGQLLDTFLFQHLKMSKGMLPHRGFPLIQKHSGKSHVL